MPRTSPLLWITVILASGIAAQVPQPLQLFKSYAVPQWQPLTATCPVTVVSNNSAFVCYTEGISGNETVQYVNPSTPASNGPPSSFKSTAPFVNSPIALSNLTAVAYSSDVNSSFYVMFSAISPQIRYVGRQGSVAGVAYAPDLKLTFVPIGINSRVGWYDSIVAFDVTAATESESLKWSRDLNVPVGFPFTTRMSTPVYYRGFLYVATKDHLLELNATTGAITKNATDPCNFQLADDQWLMLSVITVGQDQNGPLDAFILAANTSTAALPRTSVCRVSHNSFAQEWRTDYDDNVMIDDISGALSTLVISGRMTDIAPAMQQITWTIDAVSGVHGDTITRYLQDRYSFPAVLAQPIGGCQDTIVLQVEGKLTAYCTHDVSTVVWTSAYGCSYRPTVDAASNTIVCVSLYRSVQRLDSDGSIIWQAPALKGIFSASIVNGIVWVTDQHATVYGLSLAPNIPPPPPQPSVLFRNQVSPSVSVITTTCPLTVQSRTSAFVCYNMNGTDTVQYLNPSDEAHNGPPSPFNSTDQFVFPPIAISETAAIAFTANASSSSYVVFSSTSAQVVFKDRRGSTAQVAWAPSLNMSFVPIGVTTTSDALDAFNINLATAQESPAWTVDFPVPANYPLTTSISTPVFYGGFLYVATRSKFSKYNATTGTLLATTVNPCQLNGTGPLNLQVVTIGQDANGPLDAFIFTADTTTEAVGKQFSVCRISHNTGHQEWRIDYPDSVAIMDVTGGNNAILVSGYLRDISQEHAPLTFSIDATTGMHAGTISKMWSDRFSFPAVLPQPSGGCVETVVLQVNGKLSAYCTENLGGAPVWVSPYACTHRPTVDAATNSVVCTTWGVSVQRLDTDGNIIWYDSSISAVFTAVIADGAVWVVDQHSTLYGLSIEPAGVTTTAPPPMSSTPTPAHTNTASPAPSTTVAPSTTAVPSVTTPAPQQGGASSGLTGGEATGVAFAVIIVAAAVLGGAFMYHRRSVRRRAFKDQRTNDYGQDAAINEGGYGSLA